MFNGSFQGFAGVIDIIYQQYLVSFNINLNRINNLNLLQFFSIFLIMPYLYGSELRNILKSQKSNGPETHHLAH